MSDQPTHHRLLLVGDSPADVALIRDTLACTRGCLFHVEAVTNLSCGLERLSTGGIDAILANLSFPDGKGIAALDRLLSAAPHIPILVLSRLDGADLAKQAVQRGAQDYLPMSRLDSYTLTRAVQNMIQRKLVEEALFAEKERARVTLDSIGDAVLSTDVSGKITYLNVVAEKMTGWSREQAVGRPVSEVFQIIDGSTREPAQNPMNLAVQRNQPVGLTANCILVRRDGFESAIEDSAAPVHDREGQVTGAVIVFHDVSTARAITQKMSHLAQHDCLTDLPNRLLLSDRLTQAIAFARRTSEQLAVLFLDLDHFKNINDSLGHATGDKLLKSAAERLVNCVRRSDTVSRQGGDEFVVLLPQIEHAVDAALTAQKILNALAAPHSIAGNDLHVSTSIGVSTYPNDGKDAETLIQCADIAMYRAKENGRSNYQFFRAEMNARAVERQSLEGLLRRALERHEFLLHYQPKIDLQTGEITGVEALLRWRHPGRGLVSPLQFVPIAEECGLIVPIGRWVLREACAQLRTWLNAGLPPVSVAVNISTTEFRAKDFLESVRSILQQTAVDPCFLEFELTESVLMNDAESTISTLQALKSLGVRLAVDDFGTGYSSLSNLRRLPIDALKLDQSFVHEITDDPDDAQIASAVIGMGKSLKQRVIAEGVETREQRNFLQAKGCAEGQGYFFSHPVVAGQIATLLETGIADTVLN